MSEKKSQSKLFEQAIKGFLQPVWSLLQDDSVSEVMINGYNEIWIESQGKLQKTEATFKDEDALLAAVTSIAQSVGRVINEQTPQLDARLANGYRIHAVLPPCSRKGVTVAIRKFSSEQFTFQDYIRFGTLTGTLAQFLKTVSFLGKNILVSGGTGSGKTTLLGTLCSHIPPGQRVIVIEDASELRVDYEHVVFFETKMSNAQGQGEINIKDLLKSSLRLRPDRIIVGEVRGAEALDLINAMNTGHKGCLGTIHANNCHDAIVRLEALAQSSDAKLSEKSLQHQISSAIDLIVQISRCPDGSRKITQVSEILGFQNGHYELVDLFKMGRLIKKEDGKWHGSLEPTGQIPTFMQEIQDHKLHFSKTAFQKKIPA